MGKPAVKDISPGQPYVQVLSWGGDVVRWLYVSAQRSPKQRMLVVEAFAAWVRSGLLYEQELPQQEVQGLLSLTFQCLLHSSEGQRPALYDCKGVCTQAIYSI